MNNLREFYDPDTVDLMQWIQEKTPAESVISGSMQLMAGVKLCSNRTITNHPHFEDKQLRERTKVGLILSYFTKCFHNFVHLGIVSDVCKGQPKDCSSDSKEISCKLCHPRRQYLFGSQGTMQSS